jgi:hypothetical protein
MMTEPHTQPAAGQQKPRLGGHSWMMIACCIPMIVIAIALVAAGVASPGLLFAAVACTAMMALMMRGMHHGRDQAGHDHSAHAGHRPGDR